LRPWRHIKVITLLAPTPLFVVPGVGFVFLGFLLMISQLFAPRNDALSFFGRHMSFHWSIVGSTLVLLGYQLLAFYFFSRIFFVSEGVEQESEFLARALKVFTLERVTALAWLSLLAGVAFDGVVFFPWLSSGFGHLVARDTRMFIFGSTLIVLGIQNMLNAFLFSALRDATTPAERELARR
jgi:hypothetical protein